MRGLFTLIIAFLLASVGSAQTNKFLRSLDSELAVNSYLDGKTEEWQVFLSNPRLDDKVDIQNFDEELLSAAVFHTMNKMRKEARRAPLEFASQLDVAAQNYLNHYSSFSFEQTEKNSKKLNKAAGFAVRQLGFQPRLVDVVVGKRNMIDYNGRAYFFNRNDEETDLKLFYGHKDDLKDSTYVARPIPLHTYRSLAKYIVAQNAKSRDARRARSRAYTYMACRVEVDKRSLNRNAIPAAKVIFIFGGYRTQDYKTRQRQAQATANE